MKLFQSRYSLSVFGLLLSASGLLAQQANMITPINPNTNGSYPYNFTAVGSTVFFSADDGYDGPELWKTDGGSAGTMMVKDICAGTCGSSPQYLTAFNGVLYFIANDANGQWGLWKSDGTASGTVLVAGGAQGIGYITQLTAANGALYFLNSNGSLWKSDGTTAGTAQLTGLPVSWPNQLTSANGALFFYGYDSTTGTPGIYKSDGTVSGTSLVSSFSNGISQLLPVSGLLYIVSGDGSLWKSDGTSSGLASVAGCGSGTYCYNLVSMNGTVYLITENSSNNWYQSLSKIDPATNTVVQVAGSAQNLYDVSYPAPANGTLFFQGNGYLWKSDGTTAGTSQVGDYSLGLYGPSNFTYFNGAMYALDNSGALWKTDGSVSGTVRLSATRSSNSLTSAGGALYFQGGDFAHGGEPWRSDGSSAGTVLLKDINQTLVGSNAQNLTPLGSTLYFTADNASDSQELWRTDGSASGTAQISTGGGFSNLRAVGGTLFFSAPDQTYGSGAVWKMDSGGQPTEVAGYSLGVYYPNQIQNLNGSALFLDQFNSLWKTDGSAAGTIRLGYFASPFSLTVAGNAAYFLTVQYNSATGYDNYALWKTDGTVAGTVQVNIPGFEGIGQLYPLGSTLYFSAYNGTTWGVYGTDGTTVTQVPTPQLSYAYLEATSNGFVYFTGNDANGNSGGLWKYDPAANSTTQLIAPNGSWPQNFADVNGTLYFEYPWYGSQGMGLWKTNGATAGAGQVAGSAQGLYNMANPANITGTLFFAGYDSHGYELWRSDGSANSTYMVQDIAPGADSSNPNQMTNLGSLVIFSAWQRQYGAQLWTFPLQRSTVTATAGAGGAASISPLSADNTYLNGASLQVTATPNAGYYFTGFTTSNGQVATNPYSFLVNGSQTLQANFAPLTLALGTSSASPSFGQNVTLTATLSQSASTGNVTFFDASTSLGSASLSGGIATLSTSALATGSHSIIAVYNGSASYGAATAPALAVSVNQAATTTTLFSSSATVNAGTPISLTAQVSPATATGSVSFANGTTVIGTAPVGSGTATLSNVSLSAGAYNIVATYTGDTNYLASSSTQFAETVNKNTPTVGLVTSNASVTAGTQVTFTANVTPAAATGTVQFYDGKTALGSPVTVADGSAAYNTSTLAAGTHSISAAYSGDSNYATVTSTTVAETILNTATGSNVAVQPLDSSANSASKIASLTFSSVTQAGQTSITAYSGAPSPTLPANFKLGSPATYYDITTTAAYAGTIQVCISYTGVNYVKPANIKLLHYNTATGNWETTSSSAANGAVCGGVSSLSPFIVAEDASTTTALALSSPTSTYGAGINLNATVSPSDATGAVQFFDGATSLGQAAISNGQATLAISTLSATTHTLTAKYSGDAYYLAGASSAATETVSPATATLSFGATTFTYNGSPQTVSVTTTPSGLTGVSVSYNGSATPPASAGSYSISASLNNPNYTAGAVTGTMIINKASVSVTLGSLSQVFSNTLKAATVTTTPAGVQVSLAYSQNNAPASPLNAGQYAVTATVTDPNYTAAPVIGALTITPYQVAASVTPSAASVQYSDAMSFTVSLPVTFGLNPAAGIASLSFGKMTLGPVNLASANGALSANIPTGQVLIAPSTYPVAVTFGGANSNFVVVVPSPASVIVTPEDARATYTGALFASTSSTTSSTAAVTLSATVQDISAITGSADTLPGDITNATVTFVNRDASNAVLCTASGVGLVTAGDTKTGTATCTWNANIGPQNSQSFTVGVVVGGYYTRNNSADNTVVTISLPLTSAFITGGGYLKETASSGLEAADSGSQANFGFNVKYNKGGTNLQGNINTIVRRTESDNTLHVYQIKGNSMTSLSTNPTSTGGTATFNGKASIQDITNPANVISVDGNATLQVTMTDNSPNGTTDTIGITVWNKSGGLWFSSDWNGTNTIEQTLGGGNLVVH